jgi:hypothetical protein
MGVKINNRNETNVLLGSILEYILAFLAIERLSLETETYVISLVAVEEKDQIALHNISCGEYALKSCGDRIFECEYT